MKILLLSGLILLLSYSFVYAKNQLYQHPSPYLAMHGNDPVNWHQWDESVLKKAQKEKKLIFISIGYFACHWCHVMHKESYANPDIARLLNQYFIPIKVDRELNPVLDKRLIAFVQATRGTAGWPLNVFLTPEGYPLVGATYLPKTQFETVLKRLQENWKDDAKGLKQTAYNVNKTIATMLISADKQGNKQSIADNAPAFIAHALKRSNELQGGFSAVRQFPNAPQLLALLRLNQSEKNTAVDHFLKLTLNNMQNKGLHDEIAGGFYRYTVDPSWHTPHFEKMLYTNALLALLFQEAADYYQNPRYQQTALETMRYLLSDMAADQLNPPLKDYAFIASLSAVDNHNIEGGYYLWTPSQLNVFLSDNELKLAQLAWGISNQSALKGGHLPMMQMSINVLAKTLKQDKTLLINRLDKLKEKIKQYRHQHRVIPKDDKLLAGWNGLTLAAFAKMQSIDPTLKPSGQKLAQFLISLWNGQQLKRENKSQQQGNLGDYAAVSWGLVHWAMATNDQAALNTAKAIINQAWTLFYSKKGWKESASSVLPDILYRQHIEDSPIPSPEALLIEASLLLKQWEASLIKNNTSQAIGYYWQKKLNRVLEYSTGDIENTPYAYGYLISVAKHWHKKSVIIKK